MNLSHHTSLGIGILLALPFVIMNAIVALKPEPTYSTLGNLGIITASPLPIVPILIFLGFVGAVVSAWPMLRKGTDGKRKFYPINALFSVALFAFFAFVGFVLGEEIYRCNVLMIPNCD